MAEPLAAGVSSERASVLVVGDRSVGKSSLKHLICAPAEDCAGTHAATSSGGGSGSRTFLRAGGGPTVGCSVEVKLVVSNGRQQFIELWEMGGASQYAALRSMLQAEVPFHGIILVHDMTNRRSFENMLEVWIPEVMKGHLEGIAAGAGGGSCSIDGGCQGPASAADSAMCACRQGQLLLFLLPGCARQAATPVGGSAQLASILRRAG